VSDKKAAADPPTKKRMSPTVIIVLVVVALFAGVLVAKAMSGSATAPTTAPSGGAGGSAAAPGGVTITSVHNDAVADYEAALKTGKPVYVLFHSLTCQPCVEISAVVDKVMPGYEGKVVFVNAISDDPSAQQLASKFQFQYIPTSFFITPDGTVADSFTGAMPETDMKSRLDKLIAQ
jgi:thioredoxin-like negative regulator of GroEL